MNNPTAAMIVIGDEILSGRTRDSNMHYLAKELVKIGIGLQEVRIVSDVENEIIFAVNELKKKFNYVFTSGGIGPTHDDITADSIAKAFNVKIGVRSDAKQLLTEYYKKSKVTLNNSRLRMARIPKGAHLIENPISGAPGFQIGNVYVMAGVPSIFQSMVSFSLKNITGGSPVISQSITINLPEGEIAKALKKLASENPEVSFGSYPFLKDGNLGTDIVIRINDEEKIIKLTKEVKSLFKVKLGAEHE
jgi:molybdenum cofactor synthesis domain-containing protein